MPKGPICGLKLERSARKLGFLRIAGCDEAGRGPMFDPVVAAAVTRKNWSPVAQQRLDFESAVDIGDA